MNPITALLVDDAPERISALVVPPMGLSSSRSEMLKHSFVLEMSAAGLVEVLTPLYDAWVAESKRDDNSVVAHKTIWPGRAIPRPLNCWASQSFCRQSAVRISSKSSWANSWGTEQVTRSSGSTR